MINLSEKKAKQRYREEVVPAMRAEFGYKNNLAVPRVSQITINTGFGQMAGRIKDGRKIEKMQSSIEKDLALITGQKPVLKKAKKSIAGFHLRQGDPAGYAAALRSDKMYDFLDRLIKLALPRTRDFRGIDLKSVDQRGNLTIGFVEQTVFPEISSEEERMLFGLEVAITTTAKTNQEGIRLLSLLGIPFRAEGDKQEI